MRVRTRGWTHALALGAMLGAVPIGTVRAAEPTTTMPALDPATRFKELSARTEVAYQSRQYQAAIDHYLEAYGVLPSADVLYNIAYLYDRHLGNLELAQDFYRRVIREPNSTKEIMELSMKRLAEIDAKLSARATVLDGSGGGGGTTTTTTTTNPNTSTKTLEVPPDDGPGATPWVFIGVGTAAILGGAVFAFTASGTHDDYGKLTPSEDLDEMRDLEDTGSTQAMVADILGIGGGVLVATGIIIYLAEDAGSGKRTAQGEPARRGPSLMPMVTRGGGFGLTLEGGL